MLRLCMLKIQSQLLNFAPTCDRQPLQTFHLKDRALVKELPIHNTAKGFPGFISIQMAGGIVKAQQLIAQKLVVLL